MSVPRQRGNGQIQGLRWLSRSHGDKRASWSQNRLRNSYELLYLETWVPQKICCIYAENISGCIQVFTQLSSSHWCIKKDFSCGRLCSLPHPRHAQVAAVQASQGEGDPPVLQLNLFCSSERNEGFANPNSDGLAMDLALACAGRGPRCSPCSEGNAQVRLEEIR